MVFDSLRKGLVGLLGAGAVAFGMSGEARGGTVKIMDITTDTSIGSSNMFFQNIDGASEGYDSNDIYWSGVPPNPNPNWLQVYSNPYGEKLNIDARPINTLGMDFYLGVKGSVNNIDNSLKFKVTDTTDLFGKGITAYDATNPSQRYVIPKDGSILTVPLPNLTHGPGEYANWRLDVAPSYLKIDLQKSFDNGVTWVSSGANSPAGVGPVKITFASDALDARNPTTDSYDKAVGWTTLFSSTGNENTSHGEYGLYTRGAAFGFDGITSTNDRMKEEGRPLTSTSNILVEGYRNKDPNSLHTPITVEDYPESDKYKVVFSTNDPSFFKTFNIAQKQPFDFYPDDRYNNFNNAHTTLESILDANGNGEIVLDKGLLPEGQKDISSTTSSLAQGCLVGDGVNNYEWNSIIGPTFSFDIFPNGGTPYQYDGNSFYIEGGYVVADTVTPEPSTLALLVSAGIAGAGAEYLRRRKK